jgi:co-chaperonin GroES (HSP10)
MKLLGKRILINVPEIEKAVIELSPAQAAEREKEAIKKWTQLEIHSVGDEVEKVKAGDKVYVQTFALEGAERIDLDGKIKLLVKEFDIAIVY